MPAGQGRRTSPAWGVLLARLRWPILATAVLATAATAEIEVLPGTHLAGRTIADIARHQAGVNFVGLRRDDRIHRCHELDGPVAPGDVLVAFGLAEELEELAKLSETTG